MLYILPRLPFQVSKGSAGANRQIQGFRSADATGRTGTVGYISSQINDAPNPPAIPRTI